MFQISDEFSKELLAQFEQRRAAYSAAIDQRNALCERQQKCEKKMGEAKDDCLRILRFLGIEYSEQYWVKIQLGFTADGLRNVTGRPNVNVASEDQDEDLDAEVTPDVVG